MNRVAELSVAVALDVVVGEPPAHLHPVVGIGRLLDVLEDRVLGPADGPDAVLRGGAALALAAMVVGAAATVVARAPWPVRGVALWTMLSGRMLLDEVAAVEASLADGGVAAGRERVARLVSRDTADLDATGVRAAAISTLAENVVDAVAATLLWWTVAGLPGAAVHRLVDTADSRWGYVTPRWACRGRVAARADDVAAWLPARLTALAWRGCLDQVLRAEAARTPSPNGGWTMGAAALGLGIRVEKPGAYVLHPDGRAPDATSVPLAVAQARRVLLRLVAVAVAVAALRDSHDRGWVRAGEAAEARDRVRT